MRNPYLENILAQLNDIRRRLERLERQEHSSGSLPSNTVTYSGTPTAGQLAQWTGAGTVTQSGYAGSAVARYSGTPSAGDVAYWTAAGTVAPAGFGTANVLLADGTRALTGDWDIGASRVIKLGNLRARSVSGLRLEDDGGTAALTINDGATINVNNLGAKASPIGNDIFVIADSEDSFILKGATRTNLESLFMALAGAQSASGVKTFTDGISVGGGTDVGGDLSINDNVAIAITPPNFIGTMMIWNTGGDANTSALVRYRCPATTAVGVMYAGTNIATATGALTGTTGTDGKLTISAHTDSKLYIENRLGGNVLLRYRIWT